MTTLSPKATAWNAFTDSPALHRFMFLGSIGLCLSWEFKSRFFSKDNALRISRECCLLNDLKTFYWMVVAKRDQNRVIPAWQWKTKLPMQIILAGWVPESDNLHIRLRHFSQAKAGLPQQAVPCTMWTAVHVCYFGFLQKMLLVDEEHFVEVGGVQNCGDKSISILFQVPLLWPIFYQWLIFLRDPTDRFIIPHIMHCTNAWWRNAIKANPWINVLWEKRRFCREVQGVRNWKRPSR